jgi:HEAT repeat protein
VTEVLLRALSDHDSGVRLTAVRLLEGNADSHIVKALLELLDDVSLPVRVAARTALDKLPDEDIVDAVVSALRGGSAAMRLAAVRAVAGRAEQPAVVGALVTALSDQSPAVRLAALDALNERNALRVDHLTAIVEAYAAEDQAVGNITLAGSALLPPIPSRAEIGTVLTVDDELVWAAAEMLERFPEVVQLPDLRDLLMNLRHRICQRYIAAKIRERSRSSFPEGQVDRAMVDSDFGKGW